MINIVQSLTILVELSHSYFDGKSNKARTGHIMETTSIILTSNVEHQKEKIYIPYIQIRRTNLQIKLS